MAHTKGCPCLQPCLGFKVHLNQMISPDKCSNEPEAIKLTILSVISNYVTQEQSPWHDR